MTTTPAQGTPPLWTLERTLAFIVECFGDDAEIAKPYAVIVASEIVYDYEAERVRLKAELAESQAYALQLERALGEAWTPVEDGIHNTDGPEVLFIKEKLLSIVGEHYVYLPQGYALCRRTSSSPTAGE